MSIAEAYLDRYFDPLAESLSMDAARSILDLKPSTEMLSRVAELGEKSNAGTLTEQEREEYQALADAGTMIALLKSKARRHLSQESDEG